MLFAAAHSVANGTERTLRDVRNSVARRGKAEVPVRPGDFAFLTHSGSRASNGCYPQKVVSPACR